MSRSTRHFLIILLLLTATLGGLAWFMREPPKPPVVIATQPAVTTRPVVIAKVEPPPVKTFLDLIRLEHPDYPTTQPLKQTVSLNEAAHFVVDHPVYLCSRGDLWISRPDAPELRDLYRTIGKEQTHICRQKIEYVHWVRDDEGEWKPWIVFHEPGGSQTKIYRSGELSYVSDSLKLRWESAISLDQRIIVPTEKGAAALSFNNGKLSENSCELGGDVNLMFDFKGVLAWSPTGEMARFDGNAWAKIGSNIIQPLSFQDGAMLQVVQDGNGGTALTLHPAENKTEVDEKAITALVEKLSDNDAAVRQKSQDELMRIGPSAWPLLEKLQPDQPAEGRVRLDMVLAGKREPSFFDRTPVDGQFKTISRLRDGGCILFAQAGFTVVNVTDGDSHIVAPAYLALNPGPRVTLLDDRMLADFSPATTKIYSWMDDWILSDNAHGPRRWIGNSFENLVRKDEVSFTELVGVDRNSRWIFRDPQTQKALVIDPNLPDSSPRMPVWEITVDGGSAGWDSRDWPIMKSGGKNVWALQEFNWQPVQESDNVKILETPPATPPRTPADPILVDSNGTQYFDGKETLKLTQKDGKTITWPLPATATGSIDPQLFRTKDGDLLLYNQPGRVLMISPNPSATDPFKLTAVFTRKIPNIETPTRLWLDPADRLIFFHSKNKLAICFPSGQVPTPIKNMMPGDDDE